MKLQIKQFLIAPHKAARVNKRSMLDSLAMNFFSNVNSEDSMLARLSEDKEQMHAEVERITYRNDENGWTVLKARNVDDHTVVTVTGSLPPVTEGEHLQLIGTWSNHATYGKQFKADRAVTTRPTTRAAILRYLASGLIKGIGEKTAERIVEHFGLDTFKILDENPGCLLQVPKISKKKASEIITSWKSQKATADVMMFLSNHGVTVAYAHRIMRLYGEKSIEIISANPYQLAEDVDGIGFIKADSIAKSIGIAPDSAERMRAAIVFQMRQSEEKGHCYQTSKQILEQLQVILSLTKSAVEPILEKELKILAESGSLLTEVLRNNDEEVKTFWRPELMAAECAVSSALLNLLARPLSSDNQRVNQWIQRYNDVSPAPLSQTQAEAVRLAASSKVFVLTGGPGVGKTTTANAIIRLFKAMGKTVLLAAPTGRAAQRLSEVSSERAKTIHRLLEWQPAEGGFARNEFNQLKADVIVCDESSMLDIKLAESLVAAVPDHAQLIFIGDVDQLPSVGPGNVLRDLINSNRVPYIKLREIFRQAATSSIIRHAHTINEGFTPEFPKDVPTDCQFIEIDSSEEIKTVIFTLLKDVLPGRYNFDPIRDVQILTPMNRGELGTHNLNDEFQEFLNPDKQAHLRETSEKQKPGTLRVGDKVIQTANNYELNVFNGDIGYVVATQVEGGKTKIQFADHRVVTYEREQLDDVRLAYAITIHKSQGSEFPVVILPMSMQHYVMLQRNLIYTGLTRAKKLAIFIGSKKALAFAIRNNISVARQTNLTYRMQQE